MPFQPTSFQAPWQPIRVVGNTAYYWNPETGERTSSFVPNDEISARKKEFADWFKFQRGYRGQYKKPDKSGKVALIPRKDYTTLEHDPYAMYDYQHISKRTGVVTQVLAGNRVVINNGVVVQVRGITIPSIRTDPKGWLDAKKLTESLVLGQPVEIVVNTENEYAPNGDIWGDINYTAAPAVAEEMGWGVWDYMNIPGYWFGAEIRNIAARNIEGFVPVTTADKYSLSDTFTFTRLYHQMQGDARSISLYGKGETEGEWYEKMAIDIFGDPSNLISLEGKGIRLVGRRIMRGERYSKPLLAFKARTIILANRFEGHIAMSGAGVLIDDINRTYRRLQTLVSPAYYAINAQFGIWNAVWLGETNPLRFLNIGSILKQADNPALRDNIVVDSAISLKRYSARQVKLLMNEYGLLGRSAGMGDVANNPYTQATWWDKVWERPIALMQWEEDRIRGAMFIDRLQKGDTPDKAAAFVYHFQFNYDPKSMTAFEQAYLNKIVPFYIPRTRNAALQVEQYLKSPYKYTSLAKWQIQERRFAGEDQFKDYEANTVLVKVGDRYLKMRFPTEDITQLPEQFKTWRKAVLSTTYPIMNFPFELRENRNWFDNSRPMSDTTKYFFKKFIGRSYYMQRDILNPNMPWGDKISKHVIGATWVQPEDKQSFIQAYIDAGFSPSLAQQEANRIEARQKYVYGRMRQTVNKAIQQSHLPEPARDRQAADTWEWYDWINTSGFIMGAVARNVYILGATGQLGQVSREDKLTFSDTISFTTLHRLATGEPVSTMYTNDAFKHDPYKARSWKGEEDRGFVDSFVTDVITDFLTYVAGPEKLTGKIGTEVAGKTLAGALTRRGRRELLKYTSIVKTPLSTKLVLFKDELPRIRDLWRPSTYFKLAGTTADIFRDVRVGHQEAYWKFMAELRGDPYLVYKYIKGIRTPVYVVGNPELTSKYFLKQGFRIAGTNIELIPPIVWRAPAKLITGVSKIVKGKAVKAITYSRSGLSPAWTKLWERLDDLREGFEPPEKYKVSWYDDFQQMYKDTEDVMRSQRQLSRAELKILKDDANRAFDVWERAKILNDGASKGYFKHISDLTKETGIRLTERTEVKLSTSYVGHDRDINAVIVEMETKYAGLADREQVRNILGATREGYVQRILTPQAKMAKGITDPVLGKLDIYAPFAKHRKGDLRPISVINRESLKHLGYKKFEDDAFRILQNRTDESIAATHVYDLLMAIKDRWEIPAKYAKYLSKGYGKSNIPLLRGGLYPKELLAAIERMPMLRAHITTLTKPKSYPRRVLESIDWINTVHDRLLTIFSPGWQGQNIISTIHQNIMAGLSPLKYFQQNPKNNYIMFRTNLGEPVMIWEFEAEIAAHGLLGQPGWVYGDVAARKSRNLIDTATGIPRWVFQSVENASRLALYKERRIHGDSTREAADYVIKYHLDYSKRSQLWKTVNRFIPFPTWRLQAPQMVIGAMMERPGQFAMLPKAMEAWNDRTPEDAQMYRYMKAQYPGRAMFKVPFTDDAFAVFPFSIEEVSKIPELLESQKFQFFWQEAMQNPYILQKFAKYNLGIKWLEDGGGVANVKGDEIQITYKYTGEVITARLTPNNTLVFVDGNNGKLIKEYPTTKKGERIAIMAEMNPMKRIAAKYLRPYMYAPGELIERRDWRTGKPLETPDDWGTWLIGRIGGSAIQSFFELLPRDDIALYEKTAELSAYIGIYHAKDLLSFAPEQKKAVVRKEMRQVRRNYRGCGY